MLFLCGYGLVLVAVAVVAVVAVVVTVTVAMVAMVAMVVVNNNMNKPVDPSARFS